MLKASREYMSVRCIRFFNFMFVIFYNLKFKMLNNECMNLFVYVLEYNLRFG